MSYDINLAQISIYLFWLFFAGLVIYLRREDKREGYPLESDRKGVTVQGWPAVPEGTSDRSTRLKHPALDPSDPMNFMPETQTAQPVARAEMASAKPVAPQVPATPPAAEAESHDDVSNDSPEKETP
ncbi:MAG: hypothetical protein EA352_11785 [Gemmatimonadales bacterium]|nr:MAG: hypothetical protein EA352_11785 [Gemmatimonadales bacterium]